MLTQDVRNTLFDVADLNQLKSALNRLAAVDVGEFIADLSPERRAIAFRILQKDQAISVFEYLPPEIQEELIGALHDTQVF
jgi:magnesium transporter